MNTKRKTLNETQLSAGKPIPVKFLANKYGCSSSYVSKIINGKSAKSILAQKIIKDAEDIIAVLNRETTITL